MQKLKILVSCYACSPYRGSEPGMGWGFVKGISDYHEVHVIVEQLKWEPEISKYLNKNPELKKNLKFYFIQKNRNKTLRKIWPPSYYWFYKQWQKQAYQLALNLDSKENFDIVHQLNMVGYREPGYLWKFKKPFVWGPIGGLENTSWSFMPSLGLKGMLFYTARNLINSWDRSFSLRPKLAAKRDNSVLIAATPGVANIIKKKWKKDAEILCEVGRYSNTVQQPIRRPINEPIQIVWSGLHTARKNLPLLLNALKKVSVPYKLHVLGTGELTNRWQSIAKKLGIYQHTKWYGWLEKEDAINVMRLGHLFCITSVNDLTSTVTLEALSFGIPIVCLDHCGFGYVVTDSCGVKIPVTTPKIAAIAIADTIDRLYLDEDARYELSENALERSKDFSWETKIIELNTIYQKILTHKNA